MKNRYSLPLVCMLLFAILATTFGFEPHTIAALGPTPRAFPAPGLVKLVADQNVTTTRRAPPRVFTQSSTPTASITFNYLPAGSGPYGHNCVAFPSDAQTALDFAAGIWASLITSAQPIFVDACWATNLSPSDTLAAGGPLGIYSDFADAPSANTVYAVALANALANTDLNGTTHEVYIGFNRNMPWYYGTDGNASSAQFDLTTVGLHEIAHGLGFLGSMGWSGGQGSWGSGNPPIPYAYDRFAVNNSFQHLIDTDLFPNPSIALGSQLTSNNIFFNGTNARLANGGTNPKLYSPSSWVDGSSYSHLDYDTYLNTANQLMIWKSLKGPGIHDPGPVAMGILNDVGWAWMQMSPPTSTPTPTFTNTPTVPPTIPITEFSVPTQGSNVWGITQGPDGNIWYTEEAANKIGRISPTGTITEFTIPTANSSPLGITSGPDGNLWFTENKGNKIGRITTAGVITEYLIPTSGASPWGITAGSDGKVWFTEANGNKIGRISSIGSITEYAIPTLNSLPMGITSGPDGSLWFTEYQGHKLGRIIPSGSIYITEFPVPSANDFPTVISSGVDGNLWFTDSDGNRIVRTTPDGVMTEFPVPTANSRPVGIISGDDGNLWFTELAGNKIGRISTNGTFAEFSVPTANSFPWLITKGPDRTLWFTEQGANKISRLRLSVTANFWQNIATGQSPQARFNHGMAYDSRRGRVILYGGDNNGYSSNNDTWSYDGVSWSRLNPVTPGPMVANIQNALVYDSARDRIVFFRGDLTQQGYNDTWEFDGTTWAQGSGTRPPARSNHAMAFDSRRNVTVLFGGYYPNYPQNDTWEYDGTNWQQINYAGFITERSDHALAYDSRRGVVVLFGGNAFYGTVQDTYEYDGVAWRRVYTAVSPAARSGHSMVYDSNRQVVVMFGGVDATNTPLNDVWEYDGVNWRLIQSDMNPSRRGSALAYDSQRGAMVLFGGGYWWGPLPTTLGDTWEYRGGAVTVPTLTPTPTATPTSTTTPTRTPTNTPTSTPSTGPILVNTTAQNPVLPTDCTLSQAIQAANMDTAVGGCRSGLGADTIIVPAGSYTLTTAASSVDGGNGLPDITTRITINGAGSGVTVIRRGPSAPSFRIFHIAASGNLTINGVTISSGSIGGTTYPANSGGGGYNAGVLAVNNSIFLDNQGVYAGGIQNLGALTVSNSTFSNNLANSGSAGAIGNAGVGWIGTLSITDSTFGNNTATDNGSGGAIASGGILTITNSSFYNNTASTGGGIYAGGPNSTTSITNSALSSNSGGAIYSSNIMTIDNTRITHNSGGAIFVNSNAITITSSVLASNSGGAFYSAWSSSRATVNNSCISGNSIVSVVNSSSPSFDFTGNWWGAANGPSGAGSGSGDSVSTNIDFAPYLTSRPTFCPVEPGAFGKTSPGNATIGQGTTLNLSWQSSSGASNYEYCYDTTNNSQCDGSWISAGGSTNIAISGLSPTMTYYWQVRALLGDATAYADGNGNTWWSFTTQGPPGAFAKIIPTNGASNQSTSPMLGWGTSSLATSYEYCFDTTNNDICDNTWVNVGNNYSVVMNNLGGGTSYYWQVRAVNGGGTTYANAGTWWSFTTGGSPNTPTPTSTPTSTSTPTNTPTNTPTATATSTPTQTPTSTQTVTATRIPTSTSTSTNTATPTATLTNSPTNTPTNTPMVTATRTATPTSTGTLTPTASRTSTPTSTSTWTSTATATSTPTITQTPISVSAPIASWRMEEGSGATITDASGQGYTLTLASNPSTPLWSSNVPSAPYLTSYYSLLFDGVDDYADAGVSSAFDFVTGFTVEAWIKAAPSQNYDNAIVSKAGLCCGYEGWMLYLSGGIHAYINGGIRASASRNVLDDQWHHAAMTWDGVTLRVYVDGQPDGSAAYSTPPNSAGQPVQVGQYRYGYRNFKGNIGEVKIYNYARTANQIQADAGFSPGATSTPTTTSTATPKATTTPTSTSTLTSINTNTPTATATRSLTPTPTATGTWTLTPTATRTATVTSTPTPTSGSGTVGWTNIIPASTPVPRHYHALAYDSARRMAVLFGGDTSGVYLNDTFEWDGTRWTQRLPATSPSARSRSAAVYDAARGVTILFGGSSGGYGQADTPLGDMWSWDGTNWTRLSPQILPPARWGHAMAYDSARGVVVLYGGSNASGPLNDTWEWNGTNWIQRNHTTVPGGRYYHAMAYDSLRQVTVLFGGATATATYTNDTWEWNGTNWTQRLPSTTPPARNSHAMAYDPVRGVTVMLGGYDDDLWEWNGTNWISRAASSRPMTRGATAMVYDANRARTLVVGGWGLFASGGYGPLNDAWEWDGASWLRRDVVNAPSVRYAHSEAYDPTRRVTVLFGGIIAPFFGTSLDDTWEWNGATWTQLAPASKPSPRYYHSMAYDSGRGVTVLYGGHSSPNAALGDTWEWNGTNWTRRSPTTNPPAGVSVMAYDAARGKIILFGPNASNETWQWDGTNWTKLNPVNSPPARSGEAMAYDSARQVIVLFGGRYYNDTWEWDGTNWSERHPANSPTTGESFGMAYDARRNRTVLFGGQNSNGYLDETWEYDGTNWSMQSPSPKPVARHSMGFSYDASRGNILLFGGTNDSPRTLDDTWQYGLPSASPSSTPTPTATPTQSPTPTRTSTMTPTATATQTSTPSATPTLTLVPTGAICILVYHDLNGNGIRDVGEPLLAGASLSVKNASEQIVGSGTSKANEMTCFSNLPIGNYSVSETNLAGYTSTTPDVQTAAVNAGATTDVEFGDQAFTPTPTATFTATLTRTATPTGTATPTATPIPTATGTATPTATSQPTQTATATATSTPTRTGTPTLAPTPTRVQAQGTVNPNTGGTISTGDGKMQLSFPPNAVSGDTTVTYQELGAPSQPLPGTSNALRSFTLDARTSGGQSVTQFQQPYTLVLTYTDAEVEALGISESDLNVAYWNGSVWKYLLPCTGCSIDPVNNRITIILDHFTEFALLEGSGPTPNYIFLPFISK